MTVAVDYKAIWDLSAQPTDTVKACNLCGWEGLNNLISVTDRYGLWQQCERCPECDLVYLNPRMTKEAYARFYETAYRPLVSAFHGRDVMRTLKEEQAQYGQRLQHLLRPWIERGQNTLLDVGGSTGVVADIVASWNNAQVTIVDPGKDSQDPRPWDRCIVARTSFEDFDPGERRWHTVLLCQTADHLLDLMGSLKKIKSLLCPDGLFWSDIVDFDVTREVKIDHPFNLTESTYRKFLLKAGFTLLQVNYAPDGKHIGFLCR